MAVEIEPLVEILMESPEETATNAEFAEWLKEQEAIQGKERVWGDELILRDERTTNKSDGNQDSYGTEGDGTGSE